MHTISRFAIFVSFHRIENYVCRSMTLHRLNKIVFIHNIFSRATCCHCRHCRRYCCQLCVSPPMCCERFFFVCFFSHSIGVNKSERERRKKRNETRREKRLRWKNCCRMVGWLVRAQTFKCCARLKTESRPRAKLQAKHQKYSECV